jgi:hypothetical protein
MVVNKTPSRIGIFLMKSGTRIPYRVTPKWYSCTSCIAIFSDSFDLARVDFFFPSPSITGNKIHHICNLIQISYNDINFRVPVFSKSQVNQAINLVGLMFFSDNRHLAHL